MDQWYTRYGTLVLQLFQSIGIATGLPEYARYGSTVINGLHSSPLLLKSGHRNDVLIWLERQITERGYRQQYFNHYLRGIVAGLPPAIAHTIEQARQGDLHFLVLLLVASISIYGDVLCCICWAWSSAAFNDKLRENVSRSSCLCCDTFTAEVNMAGVIPQSSLPVLFCSRRPSRHGSGAVLVGTG